MAFDVNEIQNRWHIAASIPPDVKAKLTDYSPVMQQLLYNRHIYDSQSAEDFLFKKGSLHDPYLLLDMKPAVVRILQAIRQKEPIAIYGDYDVDGVTATALMVQVIRQLGGMVEGHIPNRFDEGYGLKNEPLDQLASKGNRLVVTVDCGIRSPEEVAYARSIGLDMIITDHHSPRGDLPEAVAVIDPKRINDPYPNKNLAGVGVAYKLGEALSQAADNHLLRMDDWLDLVAVGTISDIVPLEGENRTLVRAGLDSMRRCRRPGLNALIGVAGLKAEKLTARDIGFMIGPRLNAAGRLESAQTSFELLLSEDPLSASLLAQKLDDQNKQRQEMTRIIQQKAMEQLGRNCNKHLLFSADPEFNVGLVGLAAAKLVDSFYRPAIIGWKGDEFTRASCRSIPEFNITQALDQCASLFEHHGGHALAAGFTIRNDRLEELDFRLQEIATHELQAVDLCPVLEADMEIGLRELHPNILEDIDRLEPTGMGNREALFVSRNLRVVSKRAVGADKKHLRLTVNDGHFTFDAIAFQKGSWDNKMPDRIDLLYAYERNVFNGRESLQLNVRDIRPSQP